MQLRIRTQAIFIKRYTLIYDITLYKRVSTEFKFCKCRKKKKSVLLFIIIKKMILTCGVKLNELQILAWQAGTGYHGITISCTSVC